MFVTRAIPAGANRERVKEERMRFLVKVRMPVEAGNALAKDGTLGSTIEAILKDQKTEAAYFGLEDGMRTGFVIVNLDDPSQIPAIAEPWFLALNVSMELQPVMTPEDLAKAGPGFEAAVKKYA
jgi:hypothetical protein